MDELPRTLGELKNIRYRPIPVKQEIRKNLIARLRNHESLFPGIVGFDDSVIPQITNALLSCQDLILLGERGQAKSRIVRSIVDLLDEAIPIIAGVEIPESPYAPITSVGKQIVSELGNDTPLDWLTREQRYAEKLATPDITIADLIGEIDPVKIAEGRYLADESSIHFGLIPRANLGIFAINELPDLTERIQVGMLNILEERDVQIRGHKIHLPLDVFMVVTANPEDYTSRGRIITPLKDRFGSQVRTHYPRTLSEEIEIMEQEAKRHEMGRFKVSIPPFMAQIVAAITHEARESPDINQRSGVSVRTSIAVYEAMVANAFRRALRLKESAVVPRLSDLPYVIPALHGKIEFEVFEEGDEEKIVKKIISEAVQRIFEDHYDLNELEPVVLAFEDGKSIEVGEDVPLKTYQKALKTLGELPTSASTLINVKQELPAHLEFILEGLYQNDLLSKHALENGATYSS